MKQPITGYHLDDEGHWVAVLGCGHGQHVRHEPPWMNRPWVLTESGRAKLLGVELECVRCDGGEPVLQTERLHLDRFTVEDAEFIVALLNEPTFLQFIGDRGVRTLDDARRYITDGPVTSYDRFGFGLYLVRMRDGGVPIGMCGLLKRETLEDVDIGFAFLPAYCGKGYARESAAAVKQHAKRDIGLVRLVAIVSPGNGTSISLLTALGLRYEAAIRLIPDANEVHLFGCEL